MRPRYRKVSTQIWADEKIRSLDDDGKFAFVFLLTHPHLTAIGAMRATLHGLAAELRWSIRRFSRAIRRLTLLGMVQLDERVGLIWLPKFLVHNEPEGPNSVVKAWVHALRELPECPLRRRVAQVALTYLQGRSEAFLQALPPDVLKEFEKAAVGMPSRMPSVDAMSDPSPMPSPDPGAGAGAGAGAGEREPASRNPDQVAPSPLLPPSGGETSAWRPTILPSQPPEPGKEPGPPPRRQDWTMTKDELAAREAEGVRVITTAFQALGAEGGASEGGRVPEDPVPPPGPGSGSEGSDVVVTGEGQQAAVGNGRRAVADDRDELEGLAAEVETLLATVVGTGPPPGTWDVPKSGIRLQEAEETEEAREDRRKLEVLVDHFQGLPAPPTARHVENLVKRGYRRDLIEEALRQLKGRGGAGASGSGHPGG